MKLTKSTLKILIKEELELVKEDLTTGNAQRIAKRMESDLKIMKTYESWDNQQRRLPKLAQQKYDSLRKRVSKAQNTLLKYAQQGNSYAKNALIKTANGGHLISSDTLKGLKKLVNKGKYLAKFTTFFRGIPGLGKILIVGGLMFAASEAYASEGPKGVAKVVADQGVYAIPIVGDVKSVVDILKMLDIDIAKTFALKYKEEEPLRGMGDLM